MSDLIDQTLFVGTDVATWFLFHPKDLAHRQEDPLNWWTYDFAVSKEFTAGNLIAVCTAGDGGFKIRFTNLGRSQREQTYSILSQQFRLHVRHGCLYLDGGDFIPQEWAKDSDEIPGNWLEIPNGHYQITVHAIAWYNEPGAIDKDRYATEKALASYVVDFQSIESITKIEAPTSLPVLDPTSIEDSNLSEDFLEEKILELPLEDDYPLLVWQEQVIFPGIETILSLSEQQYCKIKRANSFKFIISQEPLKNKIATLFFASSYGNSGSIDRINDLQNRFEMTGSGDRLVEIVRIFEKENLTWVEVKPFEIEKSHVSPTLVEELKQLFANYATTNADYVQHIKYPRFYAEEVMARTEPRNIGYAIAHALNLPVNIQYDLLLATDKTLIEKLHQILTEVNLSF
jgi:hypothetical protein